MGFLPAEAQAVIPPDGFDEKIKGNITTNFY